MAKPIEPTPALQGQDAETLLASLDKTASPDEIELRTQRARQFLAAVKRPKGLHDGTQTDQSEST